MVFSDDRVRLGRDNGIAPDFLAYLLICPGVIKVHESKYFLLFQLEIVPGERRFFEVDFVRLIEARCRHDTPSMSKRPHGSVMYKVPCQGQAHSRIVRAQSDLIKL
jgi:hypothetical protein